MATEFDSDDGDTPDKEVKAEMEVLLEQEILINPEGLNYRCHALDLSTLTQAELDDITTADNGQGKEHWKAQQVRTALSADMFEMSTHRAKQKLRESIDNLKREFQEGCGTDQEKMKQEKRIREMDPTQVMVYEWTKKWMGKRKDWRFGELPPEYRTDKHQLMLLGTAGTGKTTTVQAAVAAVRMEAKDFDAVIMVAHTGVAANNMGTGSLTVDTFFRLGGENKDQDLVSEKADGFKDAVKGARLLVIDEISMINPEQFYMMHRRLEQAAKQIYRERHPGSEVPSDFGGFGGLMVIVVGDFGQIPPVRAESLMMPLVNTSSKKDKVARDNKSLEGKRLFSYISQVVQLRRIYRQKERDDFFDSNMNLRDGIVTKDHYELWQEHGLGPEDEEPEWSSSGRIISHGLQLAFENEQVGKINARRLCNVPGGRCSRSGEQQHGGMPKVMNARNAVLRADAFHGTAKRAMSKMEAYRNLRPVVHLQLMAPVMLTTNQLWDEFVVPLGLMNGARGRVVAVLYKSSEEKRSDGHQAPTGFPWEAGKYSTPLPDMVIVHFPGYKGESFFPGTGLPRTWVPVPAQRQMNVKPKLGFRISIPLRLCWGMTCHKCQGITEHDGVIIEFKTRTDRNPVADPGVAFVANTRAVKYGIQGYRNLPSQLEFMAVRKHKKFRARENFERDAATRHIDSMYRLKKWRLEHEFEEHKKWWRMQKRNPANVYMYQSDFTASSELTHEEMESLRVMIYSSGMKPFPDGMMDELRKEHGAKPRATLEQLMSAHKKKGKGAKVNFGVVKKTTKEPRATRSEMQEKIQTAIERTYAEFLQASGVGLDEAESMVKRTDADLIAAYNHIVFRDGGEAASTYSWFKYMDSERNLPPQQHKQVVARAGKRRMAVMRTPTKAQEFSDVQTRSAYVSRMHELLKTQGGVTVIDPGVLSVNRAYNACFWLSLVVAWSMNDPHIVDSGHKYYDLQRRVLELTAVPASRLAYEEKS